VQGRQVYRDVAMRRPREAASARLSRRRARTLAVFVGITMATVGVAGCSPRDPMDTQLPAAPQNPTAQCRDGSYSYSAHARGTCSWHGGVARWYKSVP